MEVKTKVLPQKGAFWGFKGKPPPSPFGLLMRSYVKEVAVFETYHYYTCVVVVQSSFGQRLIRHEWEASLPDVGLSKSLKTKAQRHFQRGQYLIGDRDESPPTIANKN